MSEKVNLIHRNNFDFLRLCFASAVIITHSYPLSGLPEIDPLHRLTAGQMSFSYLGVRGFFVISGFLIYESLLRSKGLDDYFIKRLLRIYPGLLVVLTLTVLLGVFVSVQTPADYWSNHSVFTYIPKNLSLLMLQDGIRGVFTNNPYKDSVNGSLWTIVYEVTCYVLLASLFFVKKEKRKLFILLGVFALLFAFRTSVFHMIYPGQYTFYWLDLKMGTELALYFAAGSILSIIRKPIFKYRHLIGWSCLAIFILATAFNQAEYIKYIVFPPIVVIVGSAATRGISGISEKFGDLSYGIYIYAFPVQQTLEHYFGFNYLQLMIVAFLVVLPIAYLSWHLIEKRALKYKKYFHGRTTQLRLAMGLAKPKPSVVKMSSEQNPSETSKAIRE